MQFSKISFVFALVSCAVAVPTQVQKRALTFQTYNEFQVSDGVGGDALAEVNAKFPIGADPATVSAADIAILKAARQTSENAEQQFIDELAATGAKFPDGSALSIGMTKNKVLKLRTFEMLVQAQLAQGLGGNATKSQTQLADIQKKLATNVKDDKANAGKTSQSVQFDGPTPPAKN